MKSNQLIAAVALAFVAGASFAETPVTDTTRQERMDAALQNYREQQSDVDANANSQPGPMARTEESIKRGARKTVEAVKHGAHKTGQAIGKGVRKTGEALQRGGEKLEEKSSGSSTAQ